MQLVFDQLAALLGSGRAVLMVVGHSSWNNSELDTSQLISELSAPDFELEQTYSYPVANRYMSYSRHNGASISTEYVLVLRRG